MPASEAPTAIITGASSGVGQHAGRSLAERGRFVVMACRDPAKAARVRQQEGRQAFARSCSARANDAERASRLWDWSERCVDPE